MIKKLKVLVFFLVFTNCLIVMAQSTSVNTPNKLFFEKVYLHTDRETYASGESIWFSAFLLNAQTNQFIVSSNTLYVELSEFKTNGSLERIDKRIIKLDNGKGEGDFKLKDSLPEGKYVLTAWTNWMLNFGDNFVFSKNINIVNNLDIIVDKKSTKAKKTEKNNSPISTIKKVDQIQLLPEGGSMVENIPGIVAFKSTNGSFNALITNLKNDKISQVSSPTGIGAFMITPLINEIYFLSGTYSNGESFKIEFPEVLKSGFTMRVSSKDSIINLNIGINEASGMIGKDVLVLGKSKGKTYFKLQFTIKDLQSLVKVPKNSFPEGIASIILIDEQGRPHCERLVYIEKEKEIRFKIQTNKEIYTSGDSVKVNIKLTDSLNKPVKGVVSLAAVDARFPKNQININSYLMLKSEIKGEIDNPNQYFDKENPDRFRHLDLLLLTQGWRDFIWRKLADSAIVIKRIPEQGISVSGKVRQVMANKPIPNANITLIANGAKNDKIFAAKSNLDGRYYVDGLDMFGPQILKLNSTDNKGKKNGWIQMDSLFKENDFKLRPSEVRNSMIDTTGILMKEIVNNKKLVESKLKLSDTIRLDEIKVKSSKQVRLMGDVVSDGGYPDEIYTVTSKDYDYTDLRHYLLHKSNSFKEEDIGGVFRVVFPYQKSFLQPILFDNNKQVFMSDDDQQIKDDYYNTYFGLSMNKVERVVVRHMIGSSQMGLSLETNMSTVTDIRDVILIYLTLKPGALDKRKFYTINEEVNGYYEKRSFYESNDNNSTATDLKTTIYWNPFVKTDSNGEAIVSFENPNVKFPVNIIVEGITSGGKPITGDINYSVKK